MIARRVAVGLVLGAMTLVIVPAHAARPAPQPLRAPGAIARPSSTSARPAFVPGEVLVRFAERLPAERARAAVAATGARLSERIESFDVGVAKLPAGLGVQAAIERLEDAPGVVGAEPNYLRYPAQEPPGDEPNDPLFPRQWSLDNDGQEHDVTNTPGYPSPPPSFRQGTSDSDIDADRAWTVTDGSNDVVIAVVDTGVDITHDDLDDNLWTNPGEVDDGRDNGDANALVDDVHGFDFTGAGDEDLLEDDVRCGGPDRPRCFGWDHGTHVAGIAAAESDNLTGISGVCPQCRVMVLKIFKPVDTNGNGVPDTMGGSVSAELEALDYAADMNADVVNASFGGPFWSGSERSAFQELGRRGVLAVVAAGNLNGDNDSYYERYFDGDNAPDSMGPFYPASYDVPKILSVAATDDDDKYANATECIAEEGRGFPCSFTNWGRDSVDVGAPGTDITSTVPVSTRQPDGYDTWDGTSMAAPVVSGVAGLVRSRAGLASPVDLSAAEVKNAIMNSADRPESLKSLRAWPDGVNTFTGSFTRTNGRVNAFNAVTTVDTSNATSVNDGSIAGAKRIFSRKEGSVAFPGDENDVYKKRLRKGRRYLVEVNGPRGEDFALWVYKPGVKDIWQYQAACNFGGSACRLVGISDGRGADEGGKFKANQTGTYYFHVHAHVRSRGDYAIKVRRL